MIELLQSMNPSREVLASADRYPGQISSDYDRAEIIADGVVHAIGLCLGLIGAVTIAVIAVRIERVEVAPILIYVIGLVPFGMRIDSLAAFNWRRLFSPSANNNQNSGAAG